MLTRWTAAAVGSWVMFVYWFTIGSIAILTRERNARLIGFSRDLSWRGMVPRLGGKLRVGEALLSRNRKILPAAQHRGHFTSRLKKALALQGLAALYQTVIKRAPFISDSLNPRLRVFLCQPLYFLAGIYCSHVSVLCSP